jgi:hypothetical protein
VTPGLITKCQRHPGTAADPSGLISALERADTHEERDTLLQALGQMRSKDAVPVIARLIRSDSTDGDTRTMAVEALGKIARRRFDKRPDPLNGTENLYSFCF